jgi:hypothetical protein
MKTSRKTLVSVLATTLCLTFAGLGGAQSAIANVTQVVASAPASSGSSKIIAQDNTNVLSAKETAVGQITVNAPAGTQVTAKAKNFRATKTSRKNGTVVFTKLTPGVPYTFTADKQKTQVRAITTTSPASELTVFTTPIAGSVELTWEHNDTPAQGIVSYEVTATPLTSIPVAKRGELTQVRSSTTREFTLTGLNTDALYTFTVTPINALGAGKATSAIMTESLHALTGLTYTGTPAPVDTQKPVTPIVPVTPAPTPTPAPAPGPAPKPATKTIYVCPDGYTEAGALCEQSTPYTFHSETETRGYSYHTEFIVTGWRVDPQPCSSGTAHPDGCHVALGYDTQVKDAAPAGWSDNGSGYTRTLEVKDGIPAGFSDNGSSWVKVTAKVAREVPA